MVIHYVLNSLEKWILQKWRKLTLLKTTDSVSLSLKYANFLGIVIHDFNNNITFSAGHTGNLDLFCQNMLFQNNWCIYLINGIKHPYSIIIEFIKILLVLIIIEFM